MSVNASVLGNIPAFESGDRVAFVGDSITHNGLYHTNIGLFYATRFPTKSFRHFNCGISGDTAPGVLARFDRDVATHCPTVATILLGMNDVGRELYGVTKTSSNDRDAQGAAIEVYRAAMDELATELVSIGASLIFITPTIYDQTAKLPEENIVGVNDGLKRCAEVVCALAEKYKSPVVDFHSVMDRVNLECQKENPEFTLVGDDRVHPGEEGHLVMAYEFLRAQGVSSEVSTVEIDATGGKILLEGNCKISRSDFNVSESGGAFSCREFSLPLPISEAQERVLNWVPFQSELNRQMLVLKKLLPADYTLKIDEICIGTFSAEALSAGINLADYSSTPQYKQALVVKALNDRRHAVATELRAISEVRYKFLSEYNPVPDEDGELKQALATVIEKEASQPWYDYMKEQAEKYCRVRHSEEALTQQMDALFVEMEQVSQPRVHRWEITPR